MEVSPVVFPSYIINLFKYENILSGIAIDISIVVKTCKSLQMLGNKNILQLSNLATAILGVDSSLSDFDFHTAKVALKVLYFVKIQE